MGKCISFFVLGMLSFLITSAQGDHIDTLKEEIDSVSMPVYEYWKPRYYDSIPVGKSLVASGQQDYADMIDRYRDKDFDYAESISNKLNFLDRISTWLNRFFRGLFPKTNLNFNDAFYNILAIIGGVVFLFLIYKLIFSGKKVYLRLKDDKELEDETQIAFVERNLMQVDLQHYLLDALKKENYVVAMRYQQLYNIQILHEKGYIEWTYTKTDAELMEDVQNPELRREFLECASIFDRVWFGGFDITPSEYERFAMHFKQFQQRWS